MQYFMMSQDGRNDILRLARIKPPYWITASAVMTVTFYIAILGHQSSMDPLAIVGKSYSDIS